MSSDFLVLNSVSYSSLYSCELLLAKDHPSALPSTARSGWPPQRASPMRSSIDSCSRRWTQGREDNAFAAVDLTVRNDLEGDVREGQGRHASGLPMTFQDLQRVSRNIGPPEGAEVRNAKSDETAERQARYARGRSAHKKAEPLPGERYSMNSLREQGQ